MSVGYKPIGWNKQKIRYDLVMAGLMAGYVLAFAGTNLLFFPEITPETLIIRTTGTLAILMLHVMLSIGPLCRIDRRFLPLLYNRRHLGVTMFLVALVHGTFSLYHFHGNGNVPVLVSLFASNTHYESLWRFPFQVPGFLALCILFLMAATSHDFWLKNLSPATWKSLHMLVYVAYALLVMHLVLGMIEVENSPVIVVLLGLGMGILTGLHLRTGFREFQSIIGQQKVAEAGFVKACEVADIPEKRAKVLIINDENIAVFRYEGRVSAVSNLCKHQQGPLGEGKIIDGCITCPWHGYQYLPGNGQSPAPFTEKVATYVVKIENGWVWLNPAPFPEGTPLPPALIQPNP